VDLQEQAAAAAAARAEEEERLAARPQRKAAPRPVRSRAASPSSDSEEFDSPVARYRGMPCATPQCGRVQRKAHWSGSCASDALAHLSEHSALQPTLEVLCAYMSHARTNGNR